MGRDRRDSNDRTAMGMQVRGPPHGQGWSVTDAYGYMWSNTWRGYWSEEPYNSNHWVWVRTDANGQVIRNDNEEQEERSNQTGMQWGNYHPQAESDVPQPPPWA